MPLQTSSNVQVRIARETTEGTAALAAAANVHRMRITDSPGSSLKRAQIQSAEKRDDGLKTMGRLGFKTVDGSYNGEMTIGGATDVMLEAIMRSVWSASSVLVTADAGVVFTSLEAVSSSTLALAGTGSFITQGVKVGDIVRLGATAANDGKNARVITVAANLLTFAGTPLTVAAADTNATLTRIKKLITAASPVSYSHTIEEYEEDTDLSQLFLGMKLTGFNISCKPGAMATWSATFMGLDRTLLVNGTSPHFTTPALTTGLGLIADDSFVWMNGAAAAYITGFDLSFSIAASGQAVLGSFVSPKIFDNDTTVSGSITAIRSGHANAILFDAETEFELGILLAEPGTAPVGTLGIYLPRVKIADLSAPAGGGDGPKIETMPLMVAPAVATTTRDATVAVITSSAA